jgi:CRP/FNR family transcriptional regulator, cyclic AMP receptor protein
MKQRFEGEAGRRLLTEAVRDQKLVSGVNALAEEIVALASPTDVRAGTTIIQQGGGDNDIFLILTGSFKIVVNGQKVAMRFANDHVGEMAAVQQAQRRSATVIANEDSLVLKLTEAQLAEMGSRYTFVWRNIAKELARRLEQRNAFVTAAREKIRLFVISSVEALEIARGIQNGFDHDPFNVVIWTDGVFRASQYPIESLEREVEQADFAIAVAQPDDLTESRGKLKSVVRDNVMFELGVFIGRLGRTRTFLVEPRGEEIALPSDLTGLNALTYKYGDGTDLASALGPVCNRVRTIIKELGTNC